MTDRGANVPLSEEEQRILREIEQQLYASDPRMSRPLGSDDDRRRSLRRLRWGLVGLLVALGLTVALLTVHWLAAFGGFLLCFLIGVVIEGEVRRLGPKAWRDLVDGLPGQKPRSGTPT